MTTESSAVFTDLLHLVDGGSADGGSADGDSADGRSADEYLGARAPERSGMTYGGQLLAQAMAAAHRTVDDDRQVNSIHALFLRAGEVDRETLWRVERVRDGRSFANRSVSGFQNDREIFRVIISFHVPEPGMEYRAEPDIDIASLPQPDEVPMSYIDFCVAHPDLETDADWSGQDRPMDIRYIDPPDPTGGPADTSPQLMWLRISEQLPDDPAIHQAGLAYLSDATLVDHVLLPHGFRWHDERLTGVSLDHAMWFRRPQRADEWLLYDQRVESTGGARGLATGRFYTPAGELVATCTQEGLMRWSEPL